MAGTVLQSTQQLLVENNTANLVIVDFECTGDSANGSIPSTPIIGPVQGYIVSNVEIVAGPIAPSSGYSVQILNGSGIDLLAGAAASVTASATSISTTTTVPPIYGSVTLVVSNTTQPSAKLRVVVYFRRISLTQLSVQPTGSVSTSSASGTSSFIFAENYAFTRIPTSTLTAGVPATVTLSPMPTGITSGSVNAHKLRIVDSTAGNEVVTITAQTATTVTFTPTINHSGSNYSITSASGGIQEGIKYAESFANGNCVWLPAGNTSVYGTIYCAGSPGLGVFGRGLWATNLVVDATFTAGDIFVCNSATCLVMWRDFLIGGHAAHASGYGIHIQNNTAGLPLVENVTVFDCLGGFYIDNSDYVSFRNASFEQVTNQNSTYGIRQTGTSSSNSIVGGYVFCPVPGSNGPSTAFTWCLDWGISIEAADGIDVTDVQVRANVGIAVFHTNAVNLGTAKFVNCIIDSCRKIGVLVDHTGTPTVFANIYFIGCHVIANYAVSAGEGTALPLVYCGLLGATGAITFADCIIAGGQTDGLYAVDATNLILTGNTIADNNVGGTVGVGVQIVRGDKVTIANNQIWDQRGVPLQAYGLKLSGVITNLSITGNTMKGNVSDSMLNSGTLTLSIIRDNIGIDTYSASIASAATIALPAGGNRIIIINGTTQIDTINGMIGNGDTFYAYCVNGLQFSAAGNIAKAFLTVNATLVIGQWNTTAAKWYLQGT